jgi:hypothetical protein
MVSHGKAKKLAEDLLQCHVIKHESHMKSPEIEPGTLS